MSVYVLSYVGRVSLQSRGHSPHMSHNLLPLSVIVPVPCLPMILSLLVLSLPTRALKSPRTTGLPKGDFTGKVAK